MTHVLLRLMFDTSPSVPGFAARHAEVNGMATTFLKSIQKYPEGLKK